MTNPRFKFSPTPTHIRFGQTIKVRRELLRITQRQFAEHLGISQTSLSLIERGGQEITFTQALLFASKLGVNLPSLFSLADTPLPLVPVELSPEDELAQKLYDEQIERSLEEYRRANPDAEI